jgi:hypothetical protein
VVVKKKSGETPKSPQTESFERISNNNLFFFVLTIGLIWFRVQPSNGFSPFPSQLQAPWSFHQSPPNQITIISNDFRINTNIFKLMQKRHLDENLLLLD